MEAAVVDGTDTPSAFPANQTSSRKFSSTIVVAAVRAVFPSKSICQCTMNQPNIRHGGMTTLVEIEAFLTLSCVPRSPTSITFDCLASSTSRLVSKHHFRLSSRRNPSVDPKDLFVAFRYKYTTAVLRILWYTNFSMG
jgi:hypothetical protein